ncbi:MAG: chromate transporter [Rhodospirillaceae bacterium]|nr:chromate transporter [Rhodospirillaceae bacterium]
MLRVNLNLQKKPKSFPSLSAAARVWAKIGILSFGGPAGQIAMMHRTLVEEKRWIDEERFLHALNYCMILPGPEAKQLATYIGWLLHKTVGGLIAGVLFIIPGAAVMLGLSLIYVFFSDMPLVGAIFLGIKAAVLIVVVEAVIRIGRRALTSFYSLSIAFFSFIAIFVFSVPFPFIIILAGLFGLLRELFYSKKTLSGPDNLGLVSTKDTLINKMEAAGALDHTYPSLKRSIKFLIVFLLLWFVPILLLAAAFGEKSVFFSQALFFSKLAVVTFGGAYAVLAYMAQQAVEIFGWLSPEEMLDGLGLAETTPGPLILVTQFVGFLSAYRFAPDLNPALAGALGSLITLWVTFVPCFLWIFLGAPYIEYLRQNAYLTSALSGITAAVVGVVLNLAVWFGMHVNFENLHEIKFLGILIKLPELASANLPSVGLTILAAVMLMIFKAGVVRTLAICATVGFLLSLFRTL